jgi:hypothetical protein
MDIVEINEHIRKLKCEETNWQSVEKLAALCTVRDELEEAHTPDAQTQALPPATYAAAYSTKANPQSEFVEAASAAPFGGAQEGVQAYVDKLQAELADTMAMCGAHSLADIDRSMLFGF